MPYNIKQLWEKSLSIDFFIADPTVRIWDNKIIF